MGQPLLTDTQSHIRSKEDMIVFQAARIMAVKLRLATGMRQGEVLGLPWDNIDLLHGVIKVKQSLEHTGKLKLPKTSSSIRDITIDELTVNSLRKWKDACAKRVAVFLRTPPW